MFFSPYSRKYQQKRRGLLSRVLLKPGLLPFLAITCWNRPTFCATNATQAACQNIQNKSNSQQSFSCCENHSIRMLMRQPPKSIKN
jgi:hypothetical protein